MVDGDRRLRFGALADDCRVAAFADGIDFRWTRVLALLDANLDVVATVQISTLSGNAVELAFSVDAAYHQAGLGTALMNRALLWARNRSRSHAHVHFLADNIAMRRPARGVGMEIATAGGETEAVIVLSATSPGSYAAEALAEGVVLMDLAAKARLLARAHIGAPTSRTLPVTRSE